MIDLPTDNYGHILSSFKRWQPGLKQSKLYLPVGAIL